MPDGYKCSNASDNTIIANAKIGAVRRGVSNVAAYNRMNKGYDHNVISVQRRV
ncbi:hypothetical protein D3C81_1609370 [compost metagenome]